MYTNTGYLNHKDIDQEIMNEPLVIESCGVYRLIRRPAMITTRPRGRKDYQLLYIFTGKVEFMLDGGPLILSAGNMVLYRPYEPQNYIYRLEDNPEVYWIHFSGSDAGRLLDEAGFKDSNRIYVGGAAYYAQTFLQIIHELQVQRKWFDELIAVAFRHMLLTIKRQLWEQQNHHEKITKEVENAIHYFHENYAKPINIEEYAASQHMSISWFIRSFRQYTGVPPRQYIIMIRIAKAKELLDGSDCNINEISAMVGYENALYFSRIFKKQEGISPLTYKKQNRGITAAPAPVTGKLHT